MAQGVPKSIITHSQRVCRLYKRAVRTMEEYLNGDRFLIRYESCLIRERFEQTRKEKDMRKLAAMLEEGEEECFRMTHVQPFYYTNDPGGVLYHRTTQIPDAIVDNWHPWEKVNYIDYFEKREKRKDEYEDYYLNVIMKKEVGKQAKDAEYPVPDPGKGAAKGAGA